MAQGERNYLSSSFAESACGHLTQAYKKLLVLKGRLLPHQFHKILCLIVIERVTSSKLNNYKKTLGLIRVGDREWYHSLVIGGQVALEEKEGPVYSVL